MKKLFNNLPFRLLLGIIIGVILGQIFPESVMKVVVTLQYIMGQLITFCVPLIIIGFIAPSITKLGKNASRLLGVAIVIAYVSSVCAALMSTTAGYALIPQIRRIVSSTRPTSAPVHRHRGGWSEDPARRRL